MYGSHIHEEITWDSHASLLRMVDGSAHGFCILFFLYMNYLKSVLNLTKIALYADDTVTWATGPNSVDIEAKLQLDMLNISNWLKLNKLSINVKKCKSMLVSSTGHQARGQNISIKVNGELKT